MYRHLGIHNCRDYLPPFTTTHTHMYTETGTTAYVESRLLGVATIRHSRCELVIEMENSRYHKCSTYQHSLNIMVTHQKLSADKENRTAPSSIVNYCHLSTPEKEQLSRLYSSLRTAKRHIARLEARLEEVVAAYGDIIDDETHSDLQQIMSESSDTILNRYLPDSFGRIFWQQQMQSATANAICNSKCNLQQPNLHHR